MKKSNKLKYKYDVIIFFLVFLFFVFFAIIFLDFAAKMWFLAIFLPASFLLYLLYTLFPFGKIQYWQGNKDLLRGKLLEDWGNLFLAKKELNRLLDEMQKRNIEKGELLMNESVRKYWKQSWEAVLDYLIFFNTLPLRYQDFYLLNYYEDKELHALAFLLNYLPFLYQYEAILRLIDIGDKSDDLKEFFNTSDYFVRWKLKAFDELRYSLTKWENLLRWRAGNLYFRFLRYKGFFVYPIFKEQGKGFIKSIYRLHKDLKKKLSKKWSLFFFNPFRFLRNYGLAFLYPVQAKLTKGVSFVRFTERDYLISAEQISQGERLMEPGDIMVERRNWHLTNVGIPGFWPHAAIYLGKYSVFKEYFKELEEEMGETIDNYLESHYKEFYDVYSKDDVAVIESLRDGVILQSLFESAHADYWAVMRARLTKKEKFIAVTRAIENWGKSYDYKFDFRGEDSLVCSELVYKTYLPSEETSGLTFVLEELGLGLFLAPNSIVKKFAEEYGTADQELDFVLFFDGNEEKGIAMEKGLEDFKNSWQRTKWDILQD